MVSCGDILLIILCILLFIIGIILCIFGQDVVSLVVGICTCIVACLGLFGTWLRKSGPLTVFIIVTIIMACLFIVSLLVIVITQACYSTGYSVPLLPGSGAFSCPTTDSYILHSIAISFYVACACLAGGVRTTY